MTCIEKILLAFVIVQVTLVLAKPYEPEDGDGLFDYNDGKRDFFHKRAGKRTQVFTIACLYNLFL